MKRGIAVLLTLTLLLGLLPLSGYAAESETQADSGCVPEAQLGTRSLTEAYITDEANDTRSSALPAKYDGREHAYLTPVRSQRPYSVCWTYATLAALEAYMVKHGVVDGATGLPATNSLDLSENHLAWFTYTQAYDRLGMLSKDRTVNTSSSKSYGYPAFMMAAGSVSHAVFTMMRWEGGAPEQVGGLAKADAADAGIDAAFAWQYNSVHVQSAEQIASQNRDAVKQAILEYGAGTISVRVPEKQSDKFYSGENVSLYYKSGKVNHAVTLVGWDDNYPVKNFPADSRPSKPGAWICRNSWGASWGDGGYFYLSYEDVPSSQSDCWFLAADSADNYDNIYQYDGTACLQGSSVRCGEQIANRFTANGNELLKAVSIGTYDKALSYTLQIYTDLTDETNPCSGTLRATQTGSFQYGGYHTIRLNETVPLRKGQSYAVVFQFSAQDSNYTTVMIDNSCDNGWYRCEHVVPTNSSFRTQNQGEWLVCDSFNYRIKAYSCDAVAQPKIPLELYVQGKLVRTVQGRNGSLLTLPASAETPAGYDLVGWTDEPLHHSSTCPSYYAPGSVVPLDESHSAYYALFRKGAGFELVTSAPAQWEGQYVLTTEKGGYGKVLRGLTLQNSSIAGSELSTPMTKSGIQWSSTLLTQVDPSYVFSFAKKDNSWSIQSLATGSWLSSLSGYLAESSVFSVESAAWTPAMNGKNFVLRLTGQNVYVSVNANGYFSVNSSPSKPIYLWKLRECYSTFAPGWDACDGKDCASSIFADVPGKGYWAHDAIEWAYVNNITSGTDATHFSPDLTVSRCEAMVFFYAAKNRPSIQTKKSPFKDVKKKDWFYSAVLWAVESKITSGTDATHFSPSKTCGRSEILQFLYAAMGKPGYTIKNPYKDVKKKHWYYEGAIWAYENGLERGSNGKFLASTPCTRAYVVTYLYRFITGNGLVK